MKPKHKKTISAEQFTTETSILPDVAAETVVQEAAELVHKAVHQSHADYSFYDFMRPQTGIFRDQDEPVRYLVDHALAIYTNNPDFKRKLRQDSGRDYLYSYMRHWISAEILSRTKSSLLRAYFSELTSFANGEEYRG